MWILTQWKGSVSRHGGVTTSAKGEVAPRREKEGDNVSWANANLTGQKMKKIHTSDSTGTNGL
jgi:hypothetical protein